MFLFLAVLDGEGITGDVGKSTTWKHSTTDLQQYLKNSSSDLASRSVKSIFLVSLKVREKNKIAMSPSKSKDRYEWTKLNLSVWICHDVLVKAMRNRIAVADRGGGGQIRVPSPPFSTNSWIRHWSSVSFAESVTYYILININQCESTRSDRIIYDLFVSVDSMEDLYFMYGIEQYKFSKNKFSKNISRDTHEQINWKTSDVSVHWNMLALFSTNIVTHTNTSKVKSEFIGISSTRFFPPTN